MNNIFSRLRQAAITAMVLLCAGIIFGCSQKEQETVTPSEDISTASVEIEIKATFSTDSMSASSTVRFTPSKDASGFRYAIGSSSDFDSFRDGSLSTIVKMEGNTPVEHTFEDLDPDTIYSLYAVAVNESGQEGSVSVAKIVTGGNEFSVSNTFLLSRSASFKLKATADFSSVNYCLGQDDDFDAFLSGELETANAGTFEEITVNYFDLEPDTDYTFFVQFVDRRGATAKIVKYPVHTPALDECPRVEFTYENDVYTGNYTLSPVNGCGQTAAVISLQGMFDELINNTQHWKGDIVSMIEAWKGVDAWEEYHVYQSVGTKELVIPFTTPTLSCGTAIEIYALVYDADGNALGVERFQCTTPQFDENAPKAEASVTVNDITSSGATYTYSVSDNTLACMYDTVDADWFDELKASDEYYEFYLHDLLFSQGYYFHYNDGTAQGSDWSFTETAGQPGHRYYAVACPMNSNGPSGWGDMVMVEFTTLEN